MVKYNEWIRKNGKWIVWVGLGISAWYALGGRNIPLLDKELPNWVAAGILIGILLLYNQMRDSLLSLQAEKEKTKERILKLEKELSKYNQRRQGMIPKPMQRAPAAVDKDLPWGE